MIAPETFQRGTLWPEFEALSGELEKHLDAITDRVGREATHGDVSDAPEGEPKALPAPSDLSRYAARAEPSAARAAAIARAYVSGHSADGSRSPARGFASVLRR